MNQLNAYDTYYFIKTAVWTILFVKMFKKLKNEYLELDPKDFNNDGEFLIYSNVMKHINEHIDVILICLECILYSYQSVQIDENTFNQNINYSILIGYLKTITNPIWINKRGKALEKQWNDIILNLSYFINKRKIIYSTMRL